MSNKKNVIVIGATSGIGLSTALKLKDIGHNVVIIGRNKEKLKNLEYKYGIMGYKIDLANTREIASKISELLKNLSRIDCFINCAGIGLFGNLINLTDEEIIECCNINFTGTILLEKYVAKLMIDQHSGHIITIESLASDNGICNGEIYSATKAGISMFNSILEKKLRLSNIKVTSIKPGLVNTKLIDLLQIDEKKKLYGLQTEDVTRAIIFAMDQPDNATISEIKVRPFDKKGQSQFQEMINLKYS